MIRINAFVAVEIFVFGAVYAIIVLVVFHSDLIFPHRLPIQYQGISHNFYLSKLLFGKRSFVLRLYYLFITPAGC